MIYFIIDKYLPGGSWPPVEKIEQLCTHNKDVAELTAHARYVGKTPEARKRTVEYYLTEMAEEDFTDPRPMCQRWIIIKRWK